MAGKRYRVAILFPADITQMQSIDLEDTRFAAIAAALRESGLEVEGVPYADEAVEEVHARLRRLDGVLVWANPIIEPGRDRTTLNALLEDVASAGVYVSTHPEVIHKMGTKDVLYRTQTMTWGCDTRHYPTLQAMQAEFQDCLAAGQTRVLKQDRGSSGDGVWKVELAGTVIQSAGTISPAAPVRVRHAKRGSVEEEMLLDQFMLRCEPYFEGRGGMIDQLYQSRLTDGMVRCYMVRDRVAGFGEQLINALSPAAVGVDPETAPEPGPRLYYPPTRADFQPLKDRMEGEWLPNLCQMLELDPAKLPIIWDADFLYGPKDGAGADTYVLCKINVSSVYPIPDDALAPLAAATLAQLEARH